jgi:hypothetical protein
MAKNDLINKIALQIAERIRELATLQGRIPVLSGDLKKSIDKTEAIEHVGEGEYTLSSNLAYARAVHDGRPAIVIKPRNKKLLAWPIKGTLYTKGGNKRGKGNKQIKWAFAKEVHQPARVGRPFIQEGADDMAARGFDFLDPLLKQYVSDEIGKQIKDSITLDLKI